MSTPPPRRPPSAVRPTSPTVHPLAIFFLANPETQPQEPFNLNKADDHGNTLLMVAVQNSNLKISKLFVNKGANPNHQVRLPAGVAAAAVAAAAVTAGDK